MPGFPGELRRHFAQLGEAEIRPDGQGRFTDDDLDRGWTETAATGSLGRRARCRCGKNADQDGTEDGRCLANLRS